MTAARIVAAVSVPHTPYFPLTLAADPASPDAAGYAAVRERLEAAAPDVIVAFDCDHLNAFFFDALPTFAVASVERFGGPSDQTAGIEPGWVPSHAALGEHILRRTLDDGFDLVRSQRLDVDHSLFVPLHFLVPERDVPLVPVFINGLVPPLPRADRVQAFGAAVGRAIRCFEEPLRVVLLATGSINHEVGGPRVHPGELWGTPGPAWLEHVAARLRAGELDALVADATEQRLAAVGNVAGELLCVIAMLAAFGDAQPQLLVTQPRLGHAFGAWQDEEAA